jgi:probable HAF family extracellular repeat protein
LGGPPKLGHTGISRQTVVNILKREGLDPSTLALFGRPFHYTEGRIQNRTEERRMRFPAITWFICLSSIIIAAPEAPARTAEFYRLGSSFSAAGLSPDGTRVVGDDKVWTPDGGFVPYLQAELYPRDITNNSLVVGLWCAPNTGSCYEAFFTPISGPATGLGALDDWASDAFATTADGSVIVGNTSSVTGTQAFRWTSATGMIGLGNLVPNRNSHDTSYDVSADGSVVVGQSGDDLTQEAFRWTAATGMVGLGDLPGGTENSTAVAVSADGSVVVGTSQSASGTEAFRWTAATGMVGLGDLSAAPFTSHATGISADGRTIYGYSAAPDINEQGWVWTEATGMRTLDDLLINDYGLGEQLAGWRLWRISDVSDDGHVLLVRGRNPAGDLEDFVVAIPEPTTTAQLTIGLCLIIVVRVRFSRCISNLAYG